jgi:putative CocE/NonD family hydrolase
VALIRRRSCEILTTKMRKRNTFGLLGLALLGLGLYWLRRHFLGLALGLQPVRHAVSVRRGLRIGMSDGVNLAADHFAPAGNRLSPTILIRTPYGRSRVAGLSGIMSDFIAQRIAERGYNVVVQDVRGRFDSEGEFKPFVHEASDGRATLAWIERQPWFNGMLGMWGQSYVGYVQWAVAPGAPLYLKALAPSITGSQLSGMDLRDGALGLDTLLRWMVQLEAIDQARSRWDVFHLYKLIPGLLDRLVARGARCLPLGQADQKTVGKRVPFYQDILTSLTEDRSQIEELGSDIQVKRTAAAVHLVGGWYDILLRELLFDYTELRLSGQNPYLTIGPWSHLDFECLLESLRQGLTWFDACLKGDRRQLREKPVRIFVMGKNQWREMESWPTPTREERYFLHSRPSGQPGKSGLLLTDITPETSEPDGYVYDPDDPTPSVGGALMSNKAGGVDNRSLEARRDVLIYTTPKLEDEVEVIGTVRLQLYVRSSLAHTDFFGRLCDVYPDGRSINICDGLLRLEPGKGELQPDGSLRIEIDLWATAACFETGHRIRLQVSSGAHPRWSRNLGGGEPLATGTRLIAAQQTIYHDREHPSVVVLPVTGS